MNQDEEIAFLKEEFLATTDPIRSEEIADKLITIEGYEIQPFFISLLELDNGQIPLRNRAVAVLKKTGRNGAVAPLFKAIFNEENEDHNTVFVDALYTHDTTYSMIDMFKVLFYCGYDAKVAAHRSLTDHEFSFSKQEILDLKEVWEDLQQHPEKCRDYIISKPIIEETVNKFLSYLEINAKPADGFASIEEETEFLKNNVLTGDGDEIFDAGERLSWIGGDSVFNFFVSLLSLTNEQSHKRNLAAIGLKNMRDDRAVEPLLEAILKKENINYNGSLVYALEELNCSYKFKELFQILFYHGYEAQMHAYSILCEQEFSFDKNDLIKISSEWARLNERSVYSDDAKQMIEDAIEQYLPYLEEEEED